jgi:hypothetical protein
MFSKSFAVFLSICLFSPWFGLSSIALGFQTGDPNIGTPNNNEGSATGTPVMTFVDPSSGQPYGRYIIQETVPTVAFSYQEVKERVYVPKTITENKTTTVTQYVPIHSQQLQLQNVPSWNPFAQPQQVWRYVPIVQYQPNYVQVTQPVTYQKYEEQEVTRMVPVLSSQSRQVPRYVDRPLNQSPNGVNTVAGNPIPTSNPNFYQQAAQVAQANRSLSRFQTRPIDYPSNSGYQGFPNRNLLAQAPAPYYPNLNYNQAPYNTAPAYNPVPNNAANPMVATANVPTQPLANTSNTNFVIPAVPLRPNLQYTPNAVTGYNPYANTASRPLFTWPTFASGTGSLFSHSLFSSNRNTNYVASNTPVAQPYVWGNNNQNGISFRPNSSPFAAPQQNWGMTPGNNYRDPMQGGMPATVLR